MLEFAVALSVMFSMGLAFFLYIHFCLSIVIAALFENRRAVFGFLVAALGAAYLYVYSLVGML